jgi:hypothetical protein
MISQSGIKLPEGTELKIRDTGDGMYVIENGYDGSFEYFDGRPIKINVNLGNHEKVTTPKAGGPVEIKIVDAEAA